jgi:hypothetical protein
VIEGKATVTGEGWKTVEKSAYNANFRNLGQAAATIRKTARASIKKRKKASAPGTPPNTRKKALPNAILYAVNRQKQSAVIGVSAELLSTAGSPHERGGEFRDAKYPQRSFMVPALMKNLKRIPTFWRGTFTTSAASANEI